MTDRRTFVKRATGALTGTALFSGVTTEAKPQSKSRQPEILPDNPLVLFDNFHVGNRRSYSWKARFSQAMSAGFDGFEFAGVDPLSDNWKEAMDLVPDTNFKIWGFHWTTRSVIDDNAGNIEEDIAKITDNIERCSSLSIKPYFTLSLSGRGELDGPAIHERGSAKARDRHWERAYKIIKAFDLALQNNNAQGSLYPHIDWLCDTPQSVVKILNGAGATHTGPAFCSHHWYANRASDELDEVLSNPLMKRLNYVVLTNVRLRTSGGQPTGMRAVRFDEGEIDMAWLLAKLYRFGYQGPISSQGWAIGGDPYEACRRFVETMRKLRKRFEEEPGLYPLI